MRSAKRAIVLGALVAGSGLFAATPSRAQDDAPKAADAGGKVTLSGLVDWYYQYSFNHPPASSAQGGNVAGRSFDIKNDQFAFNLAELNITRTASKDIPIGLTATLTFGKTADLVHATEPDGYPVGSNGVNQTSYKYLQQIYGTYATPGAKPLTIDFGKYTTPCGYEVIESSSNDNYSRGLLFTYAVPFYHAGIRLTYPVTTTLTAQVHLVNGWNNVQDDNGGKTIGGALVWNPSPAWTWALNYMGGDESTGAYGNTAANLNTQLLDVVGTWRPNAKLKLGMNVDYASAATKTSALQSGNWSGQALYARYQASATTAVALRGEHFEDSVGLRTGVGQNLNEITATFEYAPTANLIHRLEFRHDHAGTAYFVSGGGAGKSQETLTFSQVVKF